MPPRNVTGHTPVEHCQVEDFSNVGNKLESEIKNNFLGTYSINPGLCLVSTWSPNWI